MMLGLLPLLVACKSPPDAPQELDELVGYLFNHLADEDPAAMEAGAVNLDLWLDKRLNETIEGYKVNNLSTEAVSALGEGDRDITGLVGAAVGHESPYKVQDWMDAIVLNSAMDIYGDTYSSFERTFKEGKPKEFVAGRETWLEAETWSTSSYALGLTVETNSGNQYRLVETENGPAFVYRTWLRKPATVSLDFLAVEQQYYMWMHIPKGSGSVSIQATWVIATLSDSTINEDLALDMVIGGMENNAENVDAFHAGE